MKIYKYIVGAMGTNSYVVLDEETKEAALIDPGNEGQRLLSAIESKGANLKYIILTHGHFDHIMALSEVKEASGASLLIHEYDAKMLKEPSLSLISRFSSKEMTFPTPEVLLKDGDVIQLGTSTLEVFHTPGHTPGSICLFIGDTVISGDTLFRESIGRYDFPGGDYATIMKSLTKLIKRFGDINYKILPGHGSSTTVSHELEYNLYLN